MKDLGMWLVLGGVAVVSVILLARPNVMGSGGLAGNLNIGGQSIGGGIAGAGAIGGAGGGGGGLSLDAGPNSPAPPSDTEVDASSMDALPMTPLEKYQAEEIEKIRAGCCICKVHRGGDVRCVNTVTGRSKTYRNTQNVSRCRAKCNKECDKGDGPSETMFGDDRVSGMYKTAMTKGMVNPSSMFATHKLHYF